MKVAAEMQLPKFVGRTHGLRMSEMRINRLEVAQELAVRCDYNNLKASIALKFAGLDYKDWETYEPRESERAVFRKNHALAKLLEEELDRQLQQPH